MNWGLYIHIAYCEKKCLYCDFYTKTTKTAVPEKYIDALLAQLEKFRPLNENGTITSPSTVYIGGGTPSLLTPAQAQRLIAAANPAKGAEITLEANPESATAEKLKGWKSAGVNRLSVGIQTAVDSSLKTLGRMHQAEDARLALENAVNAGFTNISGDIMLALPGYSASEFDKTLNLIKNEGATHISAYLLKVEPGSAFGKKHPDSLPGDDLAAEQYLYAVSRLEECGYHQYEVSNFAKPGYESAHNLIYWNSGNWLGIGPSAHSCMDGKRFSFPNQLQNFLEGNLEPAFEGKMTAQDYIMLRLRLNEGLNLKTLHSRFGMELNKAQLEFLHRLSGGGLVKTGNDIISLAPQGMLVQNSILAQLELLE